MIDNFIRKSEIESRSLTMSSLDNNNNKSSRSEEKYGLRPRTIIKRLQQERTRQEVPKKKPVRSKSRPAPLSKYRRKTANARERHRMKEINNAFDTLRKVLPDGVEIPTTQSAMTKITTLKLAVNYIRTLSEILKAEEEGVMDLASLQNTLQNSLQDSIQDCLEQSLQYSIQQSLQKAVSSDGSNTVMYDHSQAYPHMSHLMQQYPQTMDYCHYSTPMSASSSPSTNRGSLSSTSDFEELLSDDSGLLDDVFHDIPTFCAADTFDILLGADKDGLSFSHELCS